MVILFADTTHVKRRCADVAAGRRGEFAVRVALELGGQSLGHALGGDGTVLAWGANASGQLGDGSVVVRPLPLPVQGIKDAVSLAAGLGHSTALTSDGAVWSWGANNVGLSLIHI